MILFRLVLAIAVSILGRSDPCEPVYLVLTDFMPSRLAYFNAQRRLIFFKTIDYDH